MRHATHKWAARDMNELAKEIAEIAARLATISEKLQTGSEPEPIFPEEAAAKVHSGICLRCGRDKKDFKGQFRRGDCPSCRNFLQRQIEKSPNPNLEKELIEAGLLAPVGFGSHDLANDFIQDSNKRFREHAMAVKKARKRNKN